MRELEHPTAEDALVVARALRVEGIARHAGWRNRSSRLMVPLSKIQTEILRLLAAHCDPESNVAGGTPLNRNTPRYTSDIVISQDREERVAQAALAS